MAKFSNKISHTMLNWQEKKINQPVQHEENILFTLETGSYTEELQALALVLY